jgi:hypothetical protein
MSSTHDKERNTMTTPSKSYAIEFGSSMLAYVILLPICVSINERFPDSAWRFVLALVPIVPLFFALVAMLRFFGRIDELARRIHFDGFAVAAGVTGLATFAYGMLENVGMPSLSMVWVLPFTIAVWGITTAISTWRYR